MLADSRNRRVVYTCTFVVAVTLAILLTATAALAGIRWSASGVPVCTANNDQRTPAIVSDGSNGAIIAWEDYRNVTDWNIYAQHLLSGGTVDPAWPANGLLVCGAALDQQGPVITTDGAGGAIIAWSDPRFTPNPNNAVFAQRVLNTGAVDPAWPADGARVTTNVLATTQEVVPKLAPDGSNGAFVAWRFDNGGAFTINAQRMTSAGARSWGDAGVPVSGVAGVQDYPGIINDGTVGNGVIVSFDNGDVYAQRLSSAGALSWGPNGVLLCNAANSQTSAVLVSDNAGGAVVAWDDLRNTPAHSLYAQRVLAAGTVDPGWTLNGVSICSGMVDIGVRAPRVTTDMSGGAVIAWEDWRTGREIFAQRVTSAGAASWTANGVQLCNAGSLQEMPDITSDMRGGAVVAWKDTRAAIIQSYAQRVNNGLVRWAAGGVQLCPGAAGYQLKPKIISDGQYGAIATWEDWRGANQDIYAQRISDDPPSVASITPNKGLNNAQIACQINGANFADPGIHAKLRKGSGAYVYGTSNVVVNEGAMTCNFDLTGLPYGAYDVWMFAGNGQSGMLASGFTVKSWNPIIGTILPLEAKPGDLVTITGGGFGDTQGAGASGGAASYVSFGPVRATGYSSWSDTEIKCYVPQGATTGGVTVTTAGGTSNSLALTVIYPDWYLAEGSTAWGFSTYIAVLNPNATAVTVDLTYMPTGEPNAVQTIEMPASSQAIVNPADRIGSKDFSTKVSCRGGMNIAADRTMSWTGKGAPTNECHGSVGVTAPATTWYLPEGSTNWGFETWLLIQNPNAAAANCTLTYMVEGVGAWPVPHMVPANSRATFSMGTDIGSADASVMVTSDIPVIPERAMYRNDRREGHDSIGSTTPAADFFLAEGTTAWGFTTYVLVQNPNATPTDVTVTYMTPQGPVTQALFQMAANSRKTIRVNDIAGVSNTDLSTWVHGTQPILAERAMYWQSSSGEVCHDSIGMAAPHTTFYLPDGHSASTDAETWTLVQNPNAAAVTVTVSYLSEGGQTPVRTVTDTVAANSRKTFSMAQAGATGRNGIVVTSTGGPVMVERAMYWHNRQAGTDTIGGFAD